MNDIFIDIGKPSVEEMRRWYPCPYVKPGSYVYASDYWLHINVPLKVVGVFTDKVLVQLPSFWENIENKHDIQGWKPEDRLFKNELEKSLEKGKLYWYMRFWKPAKDHSKEYNIE